MIHFTSRRYAVASIGIDDCVSCFSYLVHGGKILSSCHARSGTFCRWEGQR